MDHLADTSEHGRQLWYRYMLHSGAFAASPVRSPTGKAQNRSKSTKQHKVSHQSAPTSIFDLFDFDCNLTHPDLAASVDELIESAAAVGVRQMLVPGATLEESQQSIVLCERYPRVLFPTAGVHPYHAHEAPQAHELATLRDLAAREDVCAVGECGLDYSKGFPAAPGQKAWFQAQLELACTLKKPLFLHERLAHDDFMALIANCQAKFNGYFPPVVVHCFTGQEHELRAYVERDYYIGLTGFICKKTHGEHLRSLLHLIPLDRLVLETDAPYMGFPKCRSREPQDAKKQYPNVPSALVQVVELVAQTLNRSPAEIAAITSQNARRFLRI